MNEQSVTTLPVETAPHPAAETKKRKFKIPFATILVALTKGKSLPLLIKGLKAVKATKVLVTFISMFISAILYGWVYGKWWFAVGFVLLIFIHEMGHVFAVWLKGLKSSMPLFIPFVGAAIFMPKIENRADEAYIGYGGPLLGTIGALIPIGIWLISPNPMWLLLGFVGLFINLFNLIPISPLDGGRITQVQGTWVKWVGLAILATYTIVSRSPGLLLIWFIVIVDFESISARIRFYIWCFISVALITFMVMGTVQAKAWEIFVFCPILLLFGWTLYDKWKKPNSEHNQPDTRPYPSRSVKTPWLVAYLLLVGFLITMIIYLSGFLPKEAITPKVENTEQPAGKGFWNTLNGKKCVEILHTFSLYLKD